MKKTVVVVVALCAALLAGHTHAEDRDHGRGRRPFPTLTYAVFGDWPYSLGLLNAAPLLLQSINADPDVSLVLHVGDIHSGSMPCTAAWNQAIFNVFEQFPDPVVYTPGDNEWTDCHKTKEGSSGYPLTELTRVRTLFFPDPSHTLGMTTKRVFSQQQFHLPMFPTDGDYVENVMWEEGGVVFVTVNMPGSNNDGLPWSGGTGQFLNEPARQQEVAERTAADIRWLRGAFAFAEITGARAVLIGLQADMWDPEAFAAGGDGLDGYTGFVQELANLAGHFGKPVLLLNGDSHKFGSDQPLADPTSATGLIHHTPAVPNLTRVTVQGSTNVPREWLRLTIDANTPDVFGWTSVVYCDAATTCPN